MSNTCLAVAPVRGRLGNLEIFPHSQTVEDPLGLKGQASTEPDALKGVPVRNALAQWKYLPTLNRQYSARHRNERRFACVIRANHAPDLARLNREVNVLRRDDAANMLVHGPHFPGPTVVTLQRPASISCVPNPALDSSRPLACRTGCAAATGGTSEFPNPGRRSVSPFRNAGQAVRRWASPDPWPQHGSMTASRTRAAAPGSRTPAQLQDMPSRALGLPTIMDPESNG